jgi:hypothetical protein
VRRVIIVAHYFVLWYNYQGTVRTLS